MKNIAILFTLLLVIGIGIYQANSTDDLSDIQLANVEALASGEGTPSNTGPREEKKCYGGGHKMVCRSINSAPCSDSSCY